MYNTTFTQPWLDTISYPFESKFINLTAGKMHYIDEGVGETILFVHGTPTWSFLYREHVKRLSKEFRCIAIDHLGFGLSEQNESFAGDPAWHANNLSEFLRELKLENVTLVVHDFGGPIGLGAAIANHQQIKRIILMNTWLWETASNKNAQKVDKYVNSGLGKLLYLGLNFSPKVLLKQGFADKKYLSKKLHRQYTKPFPSKKSRYALLKLAKSLVGSSDWYQSQWNNLSCLTDKPALILWGMQDNFITSEYLIKWKNKFPNARIKEFACGHFIQEEKSDETIEAIYQFMKNE